MAWDEIPEYDGTVCVECGEKKTIEEVESGHDLCFDCYCAHND